MLEAVKVRVAVPELSVTVEPVFVQVPPLREYWNWTVPVGVGVPGMVTLRVTDWPRAIGLAGEKVGAGTEMVFLLTTRVEDATLVALL